MPVVKWLFAAAVLAFGVSYVAGRWTQVSDAFIRINPAVLVLAFVLVLAALFLSMISWLVLWPAFGVRLGLRQGVRVFFVSQLGKYLPGSVWPIAAQAQMAKAVGLSRAASVVLSLISMLVSIAVGIVIGLVLVPFINPALIAQYWWVTAIGLAMVVCLLPKILSWGVHLVLRLLRRRDAAFDYDAAVAAKSTGAQAANWVAGGLHLWVLVVALGGAPLTTLVPCLAAFPLAFCIGILLIPVPAGIGVREAVITIILATAASGSIALTAAIVSRLLYALGDFASAGVSMLVARRSAPSEGAGADGVPVASARIR